MPLPTPREGEEQDDFIARCVRDETVRDEADGDNDVALGICHSQWRRKKMPTPNDTLLDAIRARQQKRTEFGYGIITADKYVRTMLDDVGSDVCYQVAAKGTTSFDDVLQKAAKTLVYSNPDMVVEEKARDRYSELPAGIELPKNTLMVFRHVLTTNRKDRDGDVLHPEGLEVDPKMLLLWQHVHTLPIGKMLAEHEHTTKRLVLWSCIVDDMQMSHDAAVMIDNGMGRFSHGFRALEFDETKGGFDVKRGEIMEQSLVSVPANVDAGTEEVLLSLVESGKLTSPIMKRYGETVRERRPVTVDVRLTINGKEVRHADERGNEAGNGGVVPAPAEEDGGSGDEAKAAQDDQVKGIGYGELEGSWEWVRDSLSQKAVKFLLANDINVSDEDWVYLLATYPDHALLCLTTRINGETYYKARWQMEGKEPRFVGTPKTVDIHVSAEVRERSVRCLNNPLSAKPYPNEHACRLRNPGDFQEGSFRRTTRKHDGKEYSVIQGRLEGETTMTEQAYRYAKDTWDADDARTHCQAHDGRFEAASGKAAGGEGASDIGEKAGRVLSKANEAKIRGAKDHIDDALKEDLRPTVKSALKTASRQLGEVLASLGTDEDEKPKKDAVTEAMSVVLTDATSEQQRKLARKLQTCDVREQRDKKTRDYTRHVGGKRRARNGSRRS